MRTSRIFILISLSVCVSACKGRHPRPPNVPTSAVWVDNTFIDCSVETHPKANRCTVYGDDSGEILADGLFLLNSSHAAADRSELHYAAFGNGVIYLQDARMLVPWVASERDPAHRIIYERLKTLVSKGSSQAIDCRNSPGPEAASDCVFTALAGRKPFYIRYYWQGIDSFGFRGLAGDTDGNVYVVDYDSMGWMNPAPDGAQLLDNNHTFVVPCPKPVSLVKNRDGSVTCYGPPVR
jgi:hypothetical protein